MRGKVRLPTGHTNCKKCGKKYEHFEGEGYVCIDCLTKPERYMVDVCYKGERIRISYDKQGKPLDSYERAYSLLAHINYEIENHLFDPSRYDNKQRKEYLFEVLVKKWLKIKEDEGIVSTHLYCGYDRLYFKYFYGQDVRDLRTFHINDFYQSLPDNLSKKSKKNIMAALHAFFKWLLSLEYIDRMPQFPKIKVDMPNWRWLDIDTQVEVLKAIPEEDRNIFLFMALHACRPSEARALKVKDLDFSTNRIIIRRTFTGKSKNVLRETTKTGRLREIPISSEMIVVLKRLCNKRFGDEFVFLNPRTKRPYTKTVLHKIWKRACKEVGLEDITLYEGLRHSFASQRVSRGIDIYLISKVLGHTDIRTTQRYAHVNLESLRKVVEIPDVKKCHEREAL
jgi:integrase